MSMKSMTYGTLPTYDEFCEAWDIHFKDAPEDKLIRFEFTNDKWLGSGDFDRPTLYNWIETAIKMHNCGKTDVDGPELRFASDALYVLGFEWI